MKRYLLLATSLVVCGVAAAQEEGFTKEIQVQKEYEIVVRSAERIESDVALLDTTIVRPELSYRIHPTAHITNFGTSSLRPMKIATSEWEAPHKLYLNVGGGLPLQSEADIYWSPVNNNRSKLTLRLNHEGNESKVTNLDQERLRALLLRNMAGVEYTTLVGRATAFTASIDYRGTLADAYGGVGVRGERPFVAVNDIQAKMNLAGDFGVGSKLAYDANIMGLYAWNNSGENVGRFNFNFALLGLNKLHRLLPTQFALHWSGVQSVCAEPYYDTSITFVPEWNFRIGKWVPVDIVAGYDHMIYKGAKNSLDGVITTISTSFDRYDSLIPYLVMSNDVRTQVTRDGLWENPFMAMLPLDTRKIYLAELGIKGEVANLSYKLSGASRWFSAYLYEVVVEGSPLLAYGRNDGQRVWYADAELKWRPSSRFEILARGGYISLGKAQSASDYYSPRKWSAESVVRWQPLRRLTLTARCEWKSAMELSVRGASAEKSLALPSYCDLGVGAEWLCGESLSLWLRGDNLLCQPIYHIATYRAPDMGVRLGARMRF